MMQRYGIYFAWVLASMGFLISLYFSEVLLYPPCNLCWYQRICLYPLVIFLGIAVYRGESKVSLYILPQVIIGFLFALYQVAIQEIPGFEPMHLCGVGISCTEKITVGLGFITVSMLSALNFALIAFFLKRTP